LVPLGRSAVIAVLVVAMVALSSDAGRVLSAMRDNDERCSYLGIDTSRCASA
jgi:branched-chain amino acid transport system permease protein